MRAKQSRVTERTDSKRRCCRAARASKCSWPAGGRRIAELLFGRDAEGGAEQFMLSSMGDAGADVNSVAFRKCPLDHLMYTSAGARAGAGGGSRVKVRLLNESDTAILP